METIPKFKVNDKVWYFQPAKNKLTRCWTGPFIIERLLNKSTAQIRDKRGKRIRVTIKKLKAYKSRTEFLKSLPGILQEEVSDDEDIGILNKKTIE